MNQPVEEKEERKIKKLLEGQDQGKNGLLGAAGVTLFKH
jgi:hypothetical protein